MITRMWGYWRRRLAEDLDLVPTASWYDIEHAVITAKATAAAAVEDARRAERDRAEMHAFLGQNARWWWEAGAAGEGPPA